MSKTSERLKECREEIGMSVYMVEMGTGINHSTLEGYEREHCDISGYSLRILAPFYGVTADYLLGNSDSKIGVGT